MNGRPAMQQGGRGLSGLERVAALAAGDLPSPPINDVLPFELMPPVLGEVRLRALPEARFHNPMGIVHGGWLMTLLDSAMGLAGLTMLEAEEICPTHETSVKFLRPVSVKTGPVLVTGRVISKGRNILVLDGTAETVEGKLLAHGTSTCMIISAGA